MRSTPPERVVYDLLGVMSTFLALEMPLAAVISSVTDKAAAIGKILGWAHSAWAVSVTPQC